MLDNLKLYAIFLGSQSLRRKILLQSMNIPFEVITIDTNEKYPPGLKNNEIAEFIAQKKAQAFPKNQLPTPFILITADTIVCLNNTILGKPKNENEAILMLQKLSGKKHEVITGVSITTATVQKNFSVKTDVYFKTLTIEEINYYVKNYHPFDKAGAYGIQEWIGHIGITRIDGSYFNVMGLPVQRLYEELSKL